MLDPSEVRRALAREGTIEIEELISERDLEEKPEVDTPADSQETGANGSPERGDSDADTEYRAASVLIFKDGKFLCADRTDGQGICGAGGQRKPGESPEETALREVQEKFNIVPLSLHPFGDLKAAKGLYLTTRLYFADRFTGIPEADGMEMANERWMALDELRGEDLFPAFGKSLEIFVGVLRPFTEGEDGQNRYNSVTSLDKSSTSDRIKLDNPNTGGGSGSGNHGHKGIPGQVGGSTPSASAEGKNKPCTGFADKAAAKRHRKHWNEFGVSSDADYAQKAIDFIKQPVGGNIDGYANVNGEVVRFNVSTGEYGKGVPGGRIITYFKAKYKNGVVNLTAANNYSHPT